MNTVHALKNIIRNSFVPIWAGKKKSEIRLDDRGFKEGDILRLEEIVCINLKPLEYKYTGREISAKVTHILDLNDVPGLDINYDEKWVSMSIQIIHLITDEVLAAGHSMVPVGAEDEIFDLHQN